MSYGSSVIFGDENWVFSIELREKTPQVCDLPLFVENNVRLHWIGGHVILVLLFGPVKGRIWLDRGHDLGVEDPVSAELFDVFSGGRRLFRSVFHVSVRVKLRRYR